MYDASLQLFPLIKSSDILFIDISEGKKYTLARSRAQVSREIEDACKNIEARWDTI